MHYQPKIFGVRSPGASPYKKGGLAGAEVFGGVKMFGETGVIDRDTGWWKHTLGVRSVASAE